MLSNWENEHETFFREYRDRFSEIYSKMPWGANRVIGLPRKALHRTIKVFHQLS